MFESRKEVAESLLIAISNVSKAILVKYGGPTSHSNKSNQLCNPRRIYKRKLNPICSFDNRLDKRNALK
jgi:hypothetical protein